MGQPRHLNECAQRILDVAESIFAEKGFAATSIRDITSAAGCNLAAINYHFRSKENLYVEIFHRNFGKILEIRNERMAIVVDEMSDTPSLEEVLRTFIESFLEPFNDPDHGPQLMKLIAWEIHAPRLPEGMFLEEVIHPTTQLFRKAMAKSCPELGAQETALCLFSVIGQILQIVHASRIFMTGTKKSPIQTGPKGLVDHIVRFSASGIRSYAAGCAQ